MSRSPLSDAPVQPGPIGLMAAMPQELQALIDLMPDEAAVRCGARVFWRGHLHGRELVAVLSGIGKVAAAITATLLADAFGVSQIWFTGVAGGLGTEVRVGDVVVAESLIQHDMDASPLFPRHELPGLGRSRLHPPAELTTWVHEGVGQALLDVHQHVPLHALGLPQPRVHRGLIASCDQFELPFAVIRTISDRADASAHLDFLRFVDQVASPYSLAIVSALLKARAA